MRSLLIAFLTCAGLAIVPATVAAAPATAPPVVTPPRGFVQPFCPELVARWPWAHELFPGCAPPPLEVAGRTCDGGCPRPCRAISIDPSRREPGVARYTYDDGGLIEVVRDAVVAGDYGSHDGSDRPPPGQRWCTRKGDVTRCGSAYRGSLHTVASFVHGADGRIVAFEVEDNKAKLDYTDGRLTAMRVREYRSDAWVRTTFEYDGRGRLSRATTMTHRPLTTSYRYSDDGERLVAIVADVEMHAGHTRTYVYDIRGRLVKSTSVLGNTDGTSSRYETEYAYDCPAPQPFAEALRVLDTFRARACACKDVPCGAKVAGDVDRWRRGFADLSSFERETAEEGRAFRAGLAAIDACVWSASKPAAGRSAR